MGSLVKQFCPICNKEVTPNERYPKYICNECSLKTTDKEGRPVNFVNNSLLGTGCQGIYKDNSKSEVYNSNNCFVNNILCVAEEARFGGIVIQMKQ